VSVSVSVGVGLYVSVMGLRESVEVVDERDGGAGSAVWELDVSFGDFAFESVTYVEGRFGEDVLLYSDGGFVWADEQGGGWGDVVG